MSIKYLFNIIQAIRLKDKENIEKMDIKDKLFFCYDTVLHRKLQENGIRYITCSISLSNKKYWLYEKTDQVQRIINLQD